MSEQPESAPVDFLQLAKRYALLALACAIVGALCGIGAVILDTPLYRTTIMLEVRSISANYLRNSSDPLATSYDDSNSTNLATQIRLLQSGPFVREVWERMIHQAPPSPVKPDVFSKFRHRIRPASNDPSAAMYSALLTAESSFDARAVNGTRLVELSCDSTHPEIAAQYINNVAKAFIADTETSHNESSQKGQQWLDTQFQETKGKLKDAEDRLREFGQKSGNVFTTQNSTLDDVKLKQLQGDLAKAQADRIAKQSLYETAVSSNGEGIPDLVEDPTLQGSRSKLADLESEEAALSTKFTPQYYKIKQLELRKGELKRSIADQTNALLARLRGQYEDARRHETLLRTAYANAGGQVAAQAGKAAEYVILKREVDSLHTTYDSLLQRMNESEITSSLPVAPIRLVEPARPSRFPYKPKPANNVAMGIIGGLGVAAGIAFLREKMNHRVTDPGSVPEFSNVPELGVIPKLEVSVPRRRQEPAVSLIGAALDPIPAPGTLTDLPHSEESRIIHATWNDSVSMLAESFRTTLASLVREARGTGSKVIMVTSPSPGDGKTTIASNLAIALAETGRKVVVVNIDFRRPRIGGVFHVSDEITLSGILEDTKPIADYLSDRLVASTNITGLSVLPAGKSSTHVAQLIYSPRLELLIERLRGEFDVALLDVPPILHLADARVVGRFADGVALVIRSGHTDRAMAVAAYRSLSEDGIPLFGTVLNDWSPTGFKQREYPYFYGYR